MSKELKEFNQIMLKNLKEKQAARIKAEKEAYEEAFYKLSNEEQIIIRKVEGELIQVNFKLMLEQMKKEEIKREKEEIKRLTKLIEDNRKKGKEYNKIIPIGAFIGLGVLAVITGI